ncbi:condensation domain-containing protein [Vallitalea guaymasensis]|uniref:condensation domain-containing protein n=1 Tax=Vallitalea guaymasensis TaxID=1185412 RepID=UPI000DE4A7A4|nr:condensation domain-containing protein [Vallitalea guaymasensis]
MIDNNRLEIINKLPEEKRKEFYKKLQNKITNQKAEVTLRKYNRSELIPLSTIQEQIWFYEQIIPENAAYNVPIALHLKGYIHKDLLQQVMEDITKRHEILRTTFKMVEGVPYQFIQDEIKPEIQIININDYHEDKREYAMNLVSEYAKLSFDLSVCPLFRMVLFQLDENDQILLFVIHHLLCDNWSLRLLINEIVTLYKNKLDGNTKALGIPSIQYADYCFWERDIMKNSAFIKKADYMKTKLKDKIRELPLPYDHKRGDINKWKSKSLSFQLGDVQRAKIKELTINENKTTYMILFSVYSILIYRYTRVRDILIGTSFSNRPNVNSEFVLGPFINILMMVTEIEKGCTFREVLNKVRNNVLDYHEHRKIPMYSIIKDLNIERNANTLSMFQVFFDFLNFDLEEWVIEAPKDLKMEFYIHYDILNDLNTPKFDLDLTMWETKDRIGGNIEYAIDVFNDETIQEMVKHFKILLDAMLTNLDEEIDNIPLFQGCNQSYKKLIQEADFNF